MRVCILYLSMLSRPTLCNPMDCTDSSVHGLFQARKLEWAAISSSNGSSRSGIEPYLLHLLHRRQILCHLGHLGSPVCVCMCIHLHKCNTHIHHHRQVSWWHGGDSNCPLSSQFVTTAILSFLVLVKRPYLLASSSLVSFSHCFTLWRTALTQEWLLLLGRDSGSWGQPLGEKSEKL